MRTSTLLQIGMLTACMTLAQGNANWPNWRGPNGDGSTSEGAVVTWDRTNNVAWRVSLPEPGNSSPIVWQHHVFATQAVHNRRTLLCVDRATGALRWQVGPTYDTPEVTMKESNPYCSASPVTDGERVIAFFGSAGLFCFDFEGRELWRADLGGIFHPFGSASSPFLASDLCYVYVGPGEKQSMVAVEKRTGKVAWRAEALSPTAAEAAKISPKGPPVGSWSTPAVIDVAGQKQLVMPFAFRVRSYNALTGALLWQKSDLGLQTYVTPLFTDGLLLTMSGNSTIALRPAKTSSTEGKVEPEVAWTQPRGKFRFGSGVATEHHVYYLSENGLAECWEKQTGKILWQERLQGPGKKGTSWSSLSKAGDRIYAPNQSGDVFVFAAAPEFEVISTNSVAEKTNASLALAGGDVVMRTDNALWCFRAAQKG